MNIKDIHTVQLLDDCRQAIIAKDENWFEYYKEISTRILAGEKAIDILKKLNNNSYIGRKSPLKKGE